jgi:hypothetical protein
MLVVVRNLDVERFSPLVGPLKAYAPLIVDPNTVLPLSITFECLESISRRIPQVKKLGGCIEVIQSNEGTTLGYSLKPTDMLTVREPLGISISILWGH